MERLKQCGLMDSGCIRTDRRRDISTSFAPSGHTERLRSRRRCRYRAVGGAEGLRLKEGSFVRLRVLAID